MPQNISVSMQLAVWSTAFECSDFLRIFDQASNLSILRLCETFHLTYTDRIFSRPIFASYTDKTWSRKYYKLIVSFATFSQCLHLNNLLYTTHAYPFCKTTPGTTMPGSYLELRATNGRETFWSV